MADLGMTAPNDHEWMVTYRFDMAASWGNTQTEITVNMPGLEGQGKATQLLAPWLWTFVIAPAISHSVSLSECWVMMWKAGPIPSVVIPPLEMRGQHFGAGTDRDDAAQWLLDAGGDTKWNRRVFLPSIPRGWVSGGLLTRGGWENLLEQARASFMGLQQIYPNPVASWFLAYPEIVAPSLDNPLGVGFKPVREVRVCEHTDKAPVPSGGLWP